MPDTSSNSIITAPRLLIVVTISLIAFSAPCQTAKDYTKRFEQAQSAREFLVSFDAMIHQFHSGKLNFEHEDVKTIVDLAQRKVYADSLLPSVFGWARSMFADGRVKEGLTFFMETADRYYQLGNKLGEAVSYYEIASIQHKAENLNEAEKYYRLAVDNGEQLLPYRTVINCLNGLAMILRQRQQPDLAARDFRRALNIASLKKDTAWIGILMGNIGSCHLAQKNYDSSLWYYHKNLFFIRRTGEFENEIETYALLGRVYVHRNNLATSRLYLDSAVQIIRSRRINFNDFFNPMDHIHETYSMLYAAQRDYQKSYDHFVQFHNITNEKKEKINARSLRQLESVWQFKKNQNEIILLKKINEQQRYINISFAIIILLLGGITLFVFRSARRRKKVNQELAVSNSELERLNEIKNMLFSVISHDLRSPIANLRSTLDLLKAGNLKPEEVAFLAERLGRQLEVSGSALENILQWAKAQLHNMAVKPVSVPLADLVDEVVSQLAHDYAKKKIKAVNNVPKGVQAWADHDQLEVILRNLVGNAIKFTESEGTIMISAEETSDSLRITVEDSGVGMTQTQLENIFNPNKTSSTEGTHREKGTGIGLLITREMILANKGSIAAESEPGRGTKFHVTLPRQKKS